MSDKKNENDEQTKQQVKIEDLPVEKSKQSEIKGGVPYLIRIIE